MSQFFEVKMFQNLPLFRCTGDVAMCGCECVCGGLCACVTQPPHLRNRCVYIYNYLSIYRNSYIYTCVYLYIYISIFSIFYSLYLELSITFGAFQNLTQIYQICLEPSPKPTRTKLGKLRLKQKHPNKQILRRIDQVCTCKERCHPSPSPR